MLMARLAVLNHVILIIISSLIINTCYSYEYSGTINLDVWDYGTDEQVRYLPNYSTPDEDYKTSRVFNSVYYKAQGDMNENIKTTFSVFSASQGNTKVVRADINYRFKNNINIGIGILPFRISQCRYFEKDNPWISEPDVFCKFHGLNEISESAAGVQVGYSTHINRYSVDVVAGIYDSEIDGQSKKLSIYVPVGKNRNNDKKGFSIRATGYDDQISFGYLNTKQYQYDERNVKVKFDRDLDYNTYYLSYEKDFNNITTRATLSAYIGDAYSSVRPLKFYAYSRTAEASYKRNSFTYSIFYSYYNTTTVYYPDDVKYRAEQTLDVPSWGASVRYDFNNHFMILQSYNTSSDYRPVGSVIKADANAIGLRYGMEF